MSEILNDEGVGRTPAIGLVRRAWADEAFKAELIADPVSALQRLGVNVSDGHRVEFYDDPTATIGDWTSTTEGDTTIVRVPIPARPQGDTASTAELAEISGGSIWDDIESWFTPSPNTTQTYSNIYGAFDLQGA